MKAPRIYAVLFACLAASSCSKAKREIQAANYGPILLEPASGSGREQIFRLTLSSSKPPALVGLLINDDADGANACYVFHNFNDNGDVLVNDSGSGSRPLGNAASLANKQCSIIKDGSTASIVNNQVAVAFHIRFDETFRGTKGLYVVALNGAGGTQGPTKGGTWDMWDVR